MKIVEWKKGALKTYLHLLSYFICSHLPALSEDYYNDRSFSGGSCGPAKIQTPRKGKLIIPQWSPLLCFCGYSHLSINKHCVLIIFLRRNKKDLQPAENLVQMQSKLHL